MEVTKLEIMRSIESSNESGVFQGVCPKKLSCSMASLERSGCSVSRRVKNHVNLEEVSSEEKKEITCNNWNRVINKGTKHVWRTENNMHEKTQAPKINRVNQASVPNVMCERWKRNRIVQDITEANQRIHWPCNASVP